MRTHSTVLTGDATQTQTSLPKTQTKQEVISSPPKSSLEVDIFLFKLFYKTLT